MNIKIAIADDHPMIIDGLKNILSSYPHLILIDEYANGADLMKGLEKRTPDVLLLDIQMPDHAGDELAPLIVKKHTEVRILTLTNFDSTLYANNMFKRGVHGYILKTADKATLIEAIGQVYAGEQFIDPSLRHKMGQLDSKISKTVFSKSTLTSREKEILQLIVNGLSNPEIADALFLSPSTVGNYRNNIMLKMDVSNTATLVKKALQQGLAE